MKPTETAADQKAKLHQDAIRKLDLLSEKIDSGELTFEEGIAKSEKISRTGSCPKHGSFGGTPT